MRRLPGLIFLLLSWTALVRAEEQPFAPPGWAIEARLPKTPGTDGVLTGTPQGDIKAQRFFTEQDGERTFLVRYLYPLALLPGEETGLYDRFLTDMLGRRAGEVKQRGRFDLGAFEGERVLIAHRRDRTLREVRLIVIGSTLYLVSAEWPEAGTGAARAEQFFRSVQLRPDYANRLAVQERERFRELIAGPFRVRFDATRWYPDPTLNEPGVLSLLRVGQKAEVQMIVEESPLAGSVEAAVINAAREDAENITVRKRGTRYRGAVPVVELEFVARYKNLTYINHGYFYSGPQGYVQLRGWATETDYPAMSADITDLLEGLTIGEK